MQKLNKNFLAIGAGFVFLVMAVLPWIINDEYMLELVIIFLINVLMATSYRLVTTTGDWSFCHMILVGSGAYATGLISKELGISVWLSIPLAAGVAALVGRAFIYPLLRTVGFGFFIASFAVGEFVRLVWIKFQIPFGGTRGMIGIEPPVLGNIIFYFATPYYLMTLVLVAVSLIAMYRLEKSPIGNVWKSVYEDPELAESVGIDVAKARTQAFTIGSFFAGLAGALLAHRNGSIDPSVFDINAMVLLVIWVVVGGSHTIWGPILGVIAMTLIAEFSRPLLEWRPLIYGSILIITLLFMPDGLEGLIERVSRLFARGKQQVTPKES